MSPSESAAIDAVLIARGFRIIGNVSPDVNGATDDEIAMLFVGDVKGVLRDILRLPAPTPAVEPESVAS